MEWPDRGNKPVDNQREELPDFQDIVQIVLDNCTGEMPS